MKNNDSGFWNRYYDLIRKSLVIAFALSLGLLIFYNPKSISNYSDVLPGHYNLPFQLIVRHEDQVDLLTLYVANPAVIDQWDNEKSTRFVLDTARIAIGSKVNVLGFYKDSTVAKVEYTNSWVFRGRKKKGFMLTRYLSIMKPPVNVDQN